MTVFLIDARYTTRMTELRAKLFGDNFPASAAITVSGLPHIADSHQTNYIVRANALDGMYEWANLLACGASD